MYQEQRLEKILTLLEERGNLSVKEMVDALGVSKDTVSKRFRLPQPEESGSAYPWWHSSS